MVTAEIPVVPDPRTLWSNMSPGTQWYTGIDLCSAFFWCSTSPGLTVFVCFHLSGGAVYVSQNANGIL